MIDGNPNMLKKLIPAETKQIFLPLYLRHPACIKLINSDLIFCGITEATKGFLLEDIPELYSIFFTISGKGLVQVGNKEYVCDTGSVFFSVPGKQRCYFQTGDEVWRYIWFHPKIGEYWHFLSNQDIIVGKFDDVQFLETAMRGFISEVISSDKMFEIDSSQRWRYVDAPNVFESAHSFDIRYTSLERQSLDLALAYSTLILKYLERELRKLVLIDVKSEHLADFERLWNYIRHHISSEWSLDTLAGRMNMSKSSFIRHTKKLYGKSPGNIIQTLRLEHACELLAETDYTVSNIAAYSGYISTATFIALFKKRFGKTPREQRNAFRIKGFHIPQ